MEKRSEGSRPKDSKKVNIKGRSGQPISLYPLSPEEAMQRLLKVPPETKEAQQRPIRKHD